MKGMIETPLARHWFMHTPHSAVGLGTAAKLNPALPPLPVVTPRQPASMDSRTLHVGLIAGPEATWDLAAARLAEDLRRDPNLDIAYAWEWVELGIDDPADYDCLVLLGWPAADHEHMVPGRERIKRIELYCRGAAARRAAGRARRSRGWPNFAEEVFGGRQPPGQRCRLLEVERSENAWHHPVLEGVETMIAEGEVYRGPRFSPNTTVLLYARGGEREQPVAWTTRHAGGRIFCTTLGMDDDFREPSFLRMISNAVRWTGLVHSP